MRPALVSSMLVLAAAFASAEARAQGPALAPSAPQKPMLVAVTAELDYQRGDGKAGICPDETVLRENVAAMLGFDPFAPDAKGLPVGRVRVVIARAGQSVTARIDFEDVAGVRKWSRPFTVAGTTRTACDFLVEKDVASELASELTLLALHPMEPAEAPGPPPAPISPPPPASAPGAPEPAPPASPSPTEPPTKLPRTQFEIGAGAGAAFKTAPAPAFSGALHAGVQVFPADRRDLWLSFAAEGRLDASASGPIDAQHRYALRTGLIGGSIVACGHVALASPRTAIPSVFFCGLTTVGTVRGSLDGVEKPWSLSSTYVGIGHRAGAEVRLSPFAAVRLQGEILGTARAVLAAVKTQGETWSTPSVAGQVGLAFVFTLRAAP